MRPLPLLAAILFMLCGVSAATADPVLGGPIAPDGKTHVQLYLPPALRMFNTGGSDKAGLCVFTSGEHSALFQNETRLFGWQKKMTAERGGGWPEKVDQMIAKYGPGTPYVQHTGGDLEFLRAVIASGRMPCVTYAGADPYYGRTVKVNHMVNLVHLDERWACVLDNNHVYDRQSKADNQYVWMTVAEFEQRWKDRGGGWAYALLAPPPPPLPVLAFAQAELPEAPDWSPERYEWKLYATNPGQAFLLHRGLTLGGYDFAGGYFRGYDPASRTWGPAGLPPVPPPAHNDFVGDTAVSLNYGVNYQGDGSPSYKVGATAVSREQAFKCLGQCPGPGPCPSPGPKPGPKPSPSPKPGPSPAPIPNESGKLRVTLVGDDGRVQRDLESAPELEAWRPRILVQSYPENSEMLKSLGLPSTGFHILVQLPPSGGFAGRVVANFTTYAGPAALAKELAKLDPNAPRPPEPPSPTSPAELGDDDAAVLLAAIAAAISAAGGLAYTLGQANRLKS